MPQGREGHDERLGNAPGEVLALLHRLDARTRGGLAIKALGVRPLPPHPPAPAAPQRHLNTRLALDIGLPSARGGNKDVKGHSVSHTTTTPPHGNGFFN
jgi:hypothetical protein